MKNTSKKRDPVKWVRDRAKSAYTKKSSCEICNSTQDLELHHYHSLTTLFERFAKLKNYDISTDSAVCEIRDEFIESHHSELYELVVTLCNAHHVKLHTIYGPKPLASTVEKQARWVALQKEKHESKNLASSQA